MYPNDDVFSQANILRRAALGTALHHAVPMTVRFNSSVVIDPVERYLHYESRYQSGAERCFLRSFYTTWYRKSPKSNVCHDRLGTNMWEKLREKTRFCRRSRPCV